MEVYTFILIILSVFLAFSTYRFYRLLESEKTVNKGLRSALNSVLAERASKKTKTTRKKTSK
jgi:hypothetical protein